jgi:hypothetical protein
MAKLRNPVVRCAENLSNGVVAEAFEATNHFSLHLAVVKRRHSANVLDDEGRWRKVLDDIEYR